jgi:hypothetical protein
VNPKLSGNEDAVFRDEVVGALLRILVAVLVIGLVLFVIAVMGVTGNNIL